uniref:AP2/ERF domain-containing protein n=1 Tax=Mycena chlorophos TaxID=658473 RepID=A0ABQ0LAN0_MYCCL|nr:predicted protein [Mycena chlorophos]
MLIDTRRTAAHTKHAVMPHSMKAKGTTSQLAASWCPYLGARDRWEASTTGVVLEYEGGCPGERRATYVGKARYDARVARRMTRRQNGGECLEMAEATSHAARKRRLVLGRRCLPPVHTKCECRSLVRKPTATELGTTKTSRDGVSIVGGGSPRPGFSRRVPCSSIDADEG